MQPTSRVGSIYLVYLDLTSSCLYEYFDVFDKVFENFISPSKLVLELCTGMGLCMPVISRFPFSIFILFSFIFYFCSQTPLSSPNMICWLCETTKLGTDAMCKNGPCKICTEVTEVDEEINQAMATLRRLLAKRCDLRAEHNRVHGTLMNRLPVELKNHIFQLLLPSQNEWGEIPRTERTVMRSFLASISVCRGWRNTALSNPFLWSSMHITLGSGTADLSNRINDWTLRSQMLPVAFHIDVIDENSEQPRRVLPDLMSRFSNRLQSLSFYGPSTVVCGSQHDDFQYHQLTQLRISFSDLHDQPLSLLNTTASPEKIELNSVSIRFLQISWHRLTSAKVQWIDLEGVTQLFQCASQMTYCEILSLKRGSNNSSAPPIIHHALKTLILHAEEWGIMPVLFGSLTLPRLQVLSINETILLKHLPALMHRSSCPLTKLILFLDVEYGLFLDEFRPLTGVTDLVVEGLNAMIKRLLLEGYFPDLRHLTLRLQPFKELWHVGAIPLLLDLKRPPNKSNEGRLDKFLVVDKDRAEGFDRMWNSGRWEQLKALNISLREDGFEFL